MLAAQLLKKCENNVKKIAVVGNTGKLSQQERVSRTPTLHPSLLSLTTRLPAITAATLRLAVVYICVRVCVWLCGSLSV